MLRINDFHNDWLSALSLASNHLYLIKTPSIQLLSFWPRGFADAVLGTAYLLFLLLLFLFLENFFEFHEKSGHSLHCQQVFPENNGNHCSVSTKIVEFNACPRNSWKLLQRVHENSGIQWLSTKFVEFTVCTINWFKSYFSYHRLASRSWTELFQSCLFCFFWHICLLSFKKSLRKLESKNNLTFGCWIWYNNEGSFEICTHEDNIQPFLYSMYHTILESTQITNHNENTVENLPLKMTLNSK